MKRLAWGAEPCNRSLVPLFEKVYGTNTPFLIPILSSQAKELRALGRTTEAESVERRIQTLPAPPAKAASN